MAKFRFRLQSYLDLKEKMEDRRKQEYGQALADLENERRRLEALYTDQRANRQVLKEKIHAGGFKPSEIDAYHRYLKALEKKIVEQQAQTTRAEGIVEERRLVLVEAVKERKTLESLKEKARAEYLREEQLAEQKIADEIVSYQYNHAE